MSSDVVSLVGTSKLPECACCGKHPTKGLYKFSKDYLITCQLLGPMENTSMSWIITKF